jgi:hypothetical protein
MKWWIALLALISIASIARAGNEQSCDGLEFDICFAKTCAAPADDVQRARCRAFLRGVQAADEEYVIVNGMGHMYLGYCLPSGLSTDAVARAVSVQILDAYHKPLGVGFEATGDNTVKVLWSYYRKTYPCRG